MTAAINNFVEEWGQQRKPNECDSYKTMQRETQFTFLKPAFLPTLLGNEAQNRRLFFIFLGATFRKPFHQNSYQKCYRQKEVEVEPALSTTGSSEARLLSSSHSSNIIIF